jgi:O-antigen/teichoic acid export membrane protein
MIKISNNDIYWGYFGQIFSVSSGLITLPLILKSLSADEIGINYLLLTLGSLVNLFDFGFTAQFSRNIAYVFSGAQVLKKDGVDITESSEINYRLLSTIISTANSLYKRLAFFVLIFMLSFGTWYIYFITKGFKTIDNSLSIWVLFSLSSFFNIFYSYYSSLLIGKGLIKESNKALVYSKLFTIVLTFFFLYFGLGLLGVVLSNLIGPFVNRYFSYRYFFTKDLTRKIKDFDISKNEKSELFEILWFNAKKIGLVFIGSYTINKLSVFLAGLYLSLSDVASYGLMIQLFGLLSTVSGVFFSVSQPRFAGLRTKNDLKTLIKEFAFSMNIYYITFFVGTFFILLFAPYFLLLIGSSVLTPSFFIMCLFALILFLEGNHSNFASLIVTKNNVPFVKSSLISGFFIALGDFLILKFTFFGILGLVLVQGLVQLSYANWKWPVAVFNEFKISIFSFLKLGMKESLNRFKYT